MWRHIHLIWFCLMSCLKVYKFSFIVLLQWLCSSVGQFCDDCCDAMFPHFVMTDLLHCSHFCYNCSDTLIFRFVIMAMSYCQRQMSSIVVMFHCHVSVSFIVEPYVPSSNSTFYILWLLSFLPSQRNLQWCHMFQDPLHQY